MGFQPSKMEPDVWTHTIDNDDTPDCKHATLCVKDLLIVSNYSEGITDELINKFRFNLKVTCPIENHLGCNFTRDGNGDLCVALRKCTNKMV